MVIESDPDKNGEIPIENNQDVYFQKVLRIPYFSTKCEEKHSENASMSVERINSE